MIDGTYTISVNVSGSKRNGTIVLATVGDALSANVTVNGIGNIRQVGTCTGDEFSLSGSIKLFLIGHVNYQINGLVAGNTLKATLATNKGIFDIVGTRCGER